MAQDSIILFLLGEVRLAFLTETGSLVPFPAEIFLEYAPLVNVCKFWGPLHLVGGSTDGF